MLQRKKSRSFKSNGSLNHRMDVHSPSVVNKTPTRDLLATNETKRKRLQPTRSWGPKQRLQYGRGKRKKDTMVMVFQGLAICFAMVLTWIFGLSWMWSPSMKATVDIGSEGAENINSTLPNATAPFSKSGPPVPIIQGMKQLWWSWTHPDYLPAIYNSPHEQERRYLRFPSIEQRVKLYMSNWYLPPCSDDTKLKFTVVNITNPANQWVAPMTPGRVSMPNYTMSTEDGMRSGWDGVYDLQVFVQELTGFNPNRRGIYLLQEDITMAQLVALTPRKVQMCQTNEYCPDAKELLLPSLSRVDSEAEKITAPIVPVIGQFGDSGTIRGYNFLTKDWDPFPSIPHIMKFRFAFQDKNAILAMTASDCIGRRSSNRAVIDAQAVTPDEGWTERPIYFSMDTINNEKYPDYYQPIVWKLTSLRHFAMIPDIPSYDIPFEEKKDAAVFRGALTGLYRDGYKATMKGKVNDEEKCKLIHRCRLVYQSARSKLVDARLVHAKRQAGQEQEIPNKIGNIQIYGSKYNYQQMLQYKAIIMLEGNDISSGFKWALYSNSVVLTQRPTKTSWALEELLEPWVHYIPLKHDLSDVEEQMQWIIDNPKGAKQIALQGSLWIRDLLYHPDSKRDDERIYDEMIRRYRSHFLYAPTLLEGLNLTTA